MRLSVERDPVSRGILGFLVVIGLVASIYWALRLEPGSFLFFAVPTVVFLILRSKT